MRILGYADRFSALPGESIDVRISTTLDTYDATLVRLLRGGKPGHGLVEEEIPDVVPRVHQGRNQEVTAGSYVTGELATPRDLDGWALAAWIWPTLPTAPGLRGIVTTEGDRHATTLGLDGDRLVVLRDDTEIARFPEPLHERQWYFVAASHDPATGELTVVAAPGPPTAPVRATYRPATAPVTPAVARVRVGARSAGAGTFNGKISRPVVLSRPLTGHDIDHLAGGHPVGRLGGLVVAWNFAADQHSLRVPDRGPAGVAGHCVNMPARAMTGPFWTGAETDFRASPDEYCAIHFHDDDLEDAGWQASVRVVLPRGLSSGAYALRVGRGDDVDRVPFVVRQDPATVRADILLVLPSWTYLAYANWRTYVEELDAREELYGELRLPDPVDEFLVEHPEYGRSLYDWHGDGSGVAYSSLHRPIPNLRPTYHTPTTKGLRHFAQDLYLIHWLERQGLSYAVACDDDLHQEGTGLLSGHRVVLTGSHPEYVSGAMIDALQSYVHNGGRFCYLGGNGFYWVTTPHSEAPHVVEIRRGFGTHVWASDPGETHLSGSGEPGGLWRHRGRAPQRLTGVGFTAQGFDKGSPYRRTKSSHDPAVAWVFDGVDEEVFGDVAEGLGGAAADEIDRADPLLGTPRHAWLLARSFGHSERIVRSSEDIMRGMFLGDDPGVGDPKVRSDVVGFGLPGGGAVFSVGSIGWSSAMAYADGDNAVSRITRNVIDGFLTHTEPFPEALEPLPNGG